MRNRVQFDGHNQVGRWEWYTLEYLLELNGKNANLEIVQNTQILSKSQAHSAVSGQMFNTQMSPYSKNQGTAESAQALESGGSVYYSLAK